LEVLRRLKGEIVGPTMQQEAGEETRLLKEKDGESRAGSSKALRNVAARSAPPPAARLPAQTAGSKRIARAHRRDVEKAELPEQWTGRLSMYCVCTSFNIPMVFRFFRGHPSYYTRRLGQDVVHVWKILGDDVSAEEVNTDTNRDAVWWSGVEDHYSRSAEIFIFSYGVISTWGLSEGGEWDILEALKPFQERTFGELGLLRRNSKERFPRTRCSRPSWPTLLPLNRDTGGVRVLRLRLLGSRFGRFRRNGTAS